MYVRFGVCMQGVCRVNPVCLLHVKWCVCGMHVPCIGMHGGHMQHACGICEMFMLFACGMYVACTQRNYHVLTACMQYAYGICVMCMHEACLHFACHMCMACMGACSICAFPSGMCFACLHISLSGHTFFQFTTRNLIV